MASAGTSRFAGRFGHCKVTPVVWDTPARPAVNVPMRLLDLTLPDAAANLALDEALLLAAEEGAGGEALRLWENPSHAVVLGAGGSVAHDVNVPACGADGVPILRRASGGGTVLIGPGCLCFSLVLGYDRAPRLDEIPAANRYVLHRVANALRPVVPAATAEGTSDLAVGGVKFSGNAQQRKRRFFLHHGTLLYGFDLGLIARYLNPPERQPVYRRDRPHMEFVMNLPCDAATPKRLLAVEWEPAGDYAPVPLDRVPELVAEKYGRDEWNRRR
jgi:lipoate-protein ligase A